MAHRDANARAIHLGRSSGAGDEHVVPMRLAHAASVDIERVPDAFGPAARWLGERVPESAHQADPGPCRHRFLCDLELHAGGAGPTLFRKAALVCFGEPRRSAKGWTVPLEWRAATLAPLFPVFSGQLRIAADRIELQGGYAPPGGVLGSLLDAALLGVAARGTARWFLRRVAGALA
jgi:hypothetical protein